MAALKAVLEKRARPVFPRRDNHLGGANPGSTITPASSVTTTMVMPSSARSRMTRSTSCTSSGSSAEVTSSAMHRDVRTNVPPLVSTTTVSHCSS